VASDLDDELSRILAPLEIQVAEEGRLLTCSKCLGDAPYTFRGLCGPCFIWGSRVTDPCLPKYSVRRKTN
jgi:hypothetical protein